jgi:hypothetical protein
VPQQEGKTSRGFETPPPPPEPIVYPPLPPLAMEDPWARYRNANDNDEEDDDEEDVDDEIQEESK